MTAYPDDQGVSPGNRPAHLDSANGSLFTAPGLPNRLRRPRQRGGRIIVVDPAFTKTAEVADEHIAIRPAADAHFLAGMIHTLLAEGLVRLDRLQEHVEGLERPVDLCDPWQTDDMIVADLVEGAIREDGGRLHGCDPRRTGG